MCSYETTVLHALPDSYVIVIDILQVEKLLHYLAL